jgi:hypothetical protein
MEITKKSDLFSILLSLFLLLPFLSLFFLFLEGALSLWRWGLIVVLRPEMTLTYFIRIVQIINERETRSKCQNQFNPFFFLCRQQKGTDDIFWDKAELLNVILEEISNIDF